KIAHQKEHRQFATNSFVGYLHSEQGPGTLFYIQLSRTLNDWDRNMVEIFCATVKSAYINLVLSHDVESTQRELIYALGEVAEARSQETGYHVKRVSEYARLFGELLHLDASEIDLLALASPVHDIGKLTIPDAILNKPSSLTSEEFDIIKTHTTAGNEILKGSNRLILRTAALIAMQHHEKWDGSGYPIGLKGEEIHLYGRIVALCDVFDALSSNRVYKDAWPMEKIINYIGEQKGKQFDPNLVDLFLDHTQRFITIHDTFR
ncbi:MAG: HD domain-containing protein, partial [Vallitaleaceae bacterium]|nr:HD domain-containing protein [Vallitaleaceae bacterium]